MSYKYVLPFIFVLLRLASSRSGPRLHSTSSHPRPCLCPASTRPCPYLRSTSTHLCPRLGSRTPNGRPLCAYPLPLLEPPPLAHATVHTCGLHRCSNWVLPPSPPARVAILRSSDPCSIPGFIMIYVIGIYVWRHFQKRLYIKLLLFHIPFALNYKTFYFFNT